MNMAHMKAGKVKKDYEELIKETIQLKKDGYKVLISFMVDPREERNEYFLNTYGEYFDCIKMYPLLGYFPYDKRLDPIYDWCEKNNKPVIFHCSQKNPVYYRGKDIDELLNGCIFPIVHGIGNKNKVKNFNDIRGIIHVARNRPNINIDVAHFCSHIEIMKYINGDDSSWTKLLLDAAKELPNLYMDSSFAIKDIKTRKFLRGVLSDPILCKKVLFGTDGYMNKTTASPFVYYPGIKNYIGKQQFKMISHDNIINFLR
jgi:predicted TIM-barrel fold metal-dependent hydrolase